MTNFHFSVHIINRTNKRSSVESAAHHAYERKVRAEAHASGIIKAEISMAKLQLDAALKEITTIKFEERAKLRLQTKAKKGSSQS